MSLTCRVWGLGLGSFLVKDCMVSIVCPSQVYPLSQSTIKGLVSIVGFPLSQCPSQVLGFRV